MKIITSSQIRRYFVRAIILLVTATLITAMAGCERPPSYRLNITSTDGGSVTVPGEGTFTYYEGTVIDLMAGADEGYRFINWTGNVSAITDVYAGTTTITMNSQYFITANFVELFAGGNGTGEDPYQITNWYHLNNVRDYLSTHFILMNDVDSTTAGYEELASPTANGGMGWEPISPNTSNPFNGTFAGQGYEIRDLFINRPDDCHTGLFGWLISGVIKDIGVLNVTVTGHCCVGGLVGSAHGTVSNSYSTGSVSGIGWSVGGLVGHNGGTVSNSYSTGSATSDNNVGGLVGENGGDGTVSNCYSSGNVTSYDNVVGGLMGANYGYVSNSYSTGSASGSSEAGGLVGVNGYGATVSNSYSTGSVTGDDNVGGLVGENLNGTVSKSFWDTETSGQSTSDGGTGNTTAQIKNIATFSGAGWDITAVANPGTRNPSYIWNIVDAETYPFLSWQS